MVQPGDYLAFLPRYRGVIFDFDGTLVKLSVDWEGLKTELGAYCYNRIGKNINLSPLGRKIEEVANQYPAIKKEELIDIIRSHEITEPISRVNYGLVSYYNSHQCQKYAMYSMNTLDCIKIFIDCYLNRPPDIVIGRENIREPKPGGKDIEAIITGWKLKPSEVVLVGDSDYDRLSGNLAGIETIILPEWE